MNRSISSGILALAFIIGGCSPGGTADETSTTTGEPVSTTSITESTTMEASTTTVVEDTTTTVPRTRLEEWGFPVSDEYVVETVVTDLDAGTGGLAVAADGTMYMGDFGYSGHPGDTVLRISADGIVEPFSTHEDMDSLTMTTFASDGSIHQSSYGSDRVFRIGVDGSAELIAEGIRGPTGIVELDDGTLVVEGYDSRALYKVSTDGTTEEWVVDTRMNGPNGLTMGPDGTLYVICHRNGDLWSVDPDGSLEKLFAFPAPTAHGVYHDGGVFITSRTGFVVFRYDVASGDVVIIAGSGEAGTADGRGSDASFGRLNAITLGPDGAFYVNHGDAAGVAPVSIRRIVHSP